MENYAYAYPDSGNSSPRSREIEFENPTPWEDQSQQPPNYKVKFMCSYGGKIHPRPHDNQLSYIAGETKIFSVERNIKFAVMISKLSALCGDTDVSFKYQLPGEDLDALISVTNDDDLEHMMHEYDRLFRASAKPARMRLFLFPVNPSPASFGSDGGRSDRDRFVDALNSGPSHVADTAKTAPSNVDFLFGLEKGVQPPQQPPPPAVKVPDLPELHVPMGHDDRIVGLDPTNIQTQLHRLQIRDQEQQAMYRKNMDENLVSGYAGAGEYYVQKLPDKVNPPGTVPGVSMPTTVAAASGGYWPEKQMTGGGFPPGMAVTTTPLPQEQPVYMISATGPAPSQAPGNVYQSPVMRQVTGQTGQGFYMQRMGGPEVYREQPVYNVVPPPQQTAPPPMSGGMAPVGMVRPSGAGMGVTDPGYAQVAYDNAVGRQVYYAAAGGVMQPGSYQQGGGVAVSGEMRPGGGAVSGALGQEGKVVVTKASV